MKLTKTSLNLDEMFGEDRAQEDKNLSKYFVETEQYHSIFSGNKELVLGRKGAGKSAIFSYLCEQLPPKGIIPIAISPSGEDFVLLERKLTQYSNMSFENDYKYSLAWYELVVTQIAFSLISGKNGELLKSTDAILYEYLKKNEKIKGSFVGQFANAVLKAFSGGKLKISDSELDIDLSSFNEIGSPSEAQIKDALKKLILQKNFFVLVDNLDEPWENNKEMNAWLRGLILAARRLKRDFSNLKIAVFLRDDIYYEIKKGSDIFDSRSEIVTLKWNDKHHYNLQILLAKRIANYLRKSMPTEFDDINAIIETIFPLKLHRGQNDIYTVKFIADRTFERPRDFLQFFRAAIESSYSDSLPIKEGAIFSAERDFSNWKISNLQGEYAKTYGNLPNCINFFAGLTSDWNIIYENLLKLFEKPDNSNCLLFYIPEQRKLSPNENIDALYLMGFLRKEIKSYYKISYITYIDEPNPILRGSNLNIHPAFRTTLVKRTD